MVPQPQITKMSSVIAKLLTTLDVYEGLFAQKDKAEIIQKPFYEISSTIRASLSTHLIIGCAAIFSDPEKTCGNENMSLKNLVSKHETNLGEEAKRLLDDINILVKEMNLKQFRNKHVGHFGLEECLGFVIVEREITVEKLRTLLSKSLYFINILIRDASLMPKGHSICHYSQIPESRGTEEFLKLFTKNN